MSDTPPDNRTRKVVLDVPADAGPDQLDDLKRKFFKQLTGKDLPPR